MKDKTVAQNATNKPADVAYPGMMGDGTEEQNLDERGNPAARIKKDEVEAAFGKHKGTFSAKAARHALANL
jgi:hypothetical protein